MQWHVEDVYECCLQDVNFLNSHQRELFPKTLLYIIFSDLLMSSVKVKTCITVAVNLYNVDLIRGTISKLTAKHVMYKRNIKYPIFLKLYYLPAETTMSYKHINALAQDKEAPVWYTGSYTWRRQLITRTLYEVK